MQLIFATSNKHKLQEVRQILPQNFQVLGLEEIGFTDELPETQLTIRENAIQKAETLYNTKNRDCFAEDTGLEIDALDGDPGVFSARYAGSPQSAIRNMEKVLNKMIGVQNRTARFRTVIALIIKGQLKTFEGIIEGTILEVPDGEGGFGYDPIFKPMGYNESFGRLSSSIKSKISHRALATRKLISFLEQLSPG